MSKVKCLVMNQQLLIIVNITIGGSSVLHTPRPQMGRLSTYHCLFPRLSSWDIYMPSYRIVVKIRQSRKGFECCGHIQCWLLLLFILFFITMLQTKELLGTTEYTPLLAASVCFSLPCPLPRVPPPSSLCQNPRCVFSTVAFAHHPFGT